jgi:hypothetical protein
MSASRVWLQNLMRSSTWPPPPPNTDLYVYPLKGQTPDQVDRGRYECYVWATKQTGFDPSAPNVPPHGGAVGTAAEASADQQAQASAVAAERAENRQYSAQMERQTANFRRAASACLDARGYAVR